MNHIFGYFLIVYFITNHYYIDDEMGGSFIPRDEDESSNDPYVHQPDEERFESGGFMPVEEITTYPFILEAIKEGAMVSENVDPYIPENDEEATNDTVLMRSVFDTVTQPIATPDKVTSTKEVEGNIILSVWNYSFSVCIILFVGNYSFCVCIILSVKKYSFCVCIILSV